MKIAQREPFVIEWAAQKGLIAHTVDQALAQHGKTTEEVEELLYAISDAKVPGADEYMETVVNNIRLEAGDVLVTLAIQCAIQKQSLAYAMNCFEDATQLSTMSHLDMPELSSRLGRAIRAEARPWVFAFVGRLANEARKEIAPYGLTLDECLDAAWEKIKDRKGETVGGVFVKEGMR